VAGFGEHGAWSKFGASENSGNFLDSQATAFVVLYHKIDGTQWSTRTDFSLDIAPLRVYQFKCNIY
jgi:hypothetical protein